MAITWPRRPALSSDCPRLNTRPTPDFKFAQDFIFAGAKHPAGNKILPNFYASLGFRKDAFLEQGCLTICFYSIL